jgi:3-hydroxyisobutyrate dehydrogenase
VAESARVIQIFVSDGPALLETVIAMSPALGPSHVIMNHATVSPAETREAARIVQDRHAKFLDAPFTGSRDAAQAGELVFLVGGDAETLALARPVLEANAKSILSVGAIGDATALKIATNLIAAVSVTAYAEALALLSKSGVEPQHLLDVLPNHAIHSRLADMKVPAMILDDFDPRFALKHMFKDVQIALSMAAEAGIELPSAGAFAGAAMAGMQKGFAERDFSAIAKLYSFPDSEARVDEKFRPSASAKAEEAGSDKSQPKRWSVFGARK